ncbi:MAG: ABC transporter ATP-binding protein [Acidimicrobiia bacterium]
MAAIELSRVTKHFDGREVLSQLDLEVPSGSLTVLVGPSGSGKSLILRMVAGLERPDSGTVTVGGEVVGASGRAPQGVAMVFQGDTLYAHLDVGDNLRFPLQVGGADRDHVEAVSRDSARRIGITRLWRRRTGTLSSGERGLAAAARAISRDGLAVLLLDEPLAGADPPLRRRFRSELRQLHDTEGVTTVVATNDQEEALALADRLAVVMDARIVQTGSPRTVFESPDSTSVASFVGVLPMNLFPGEFGRGDDGSFVDVAGNRLSIDGRVEVPDGARVVVGLHAHELVVAPPGTPFGRTIQGTVSRVEDFGATVSVLFGLGRDAVGTFVMTENRPAAWRPGDRLELTWAPDRLRLFRADTGRAIPM